MTTSPATVGTVLDLLPGRDGALVCVDGPAGSGKTTLADALVAAVDGAVVVHTDDLLAGWDGLPGLPASLSRLLEPLAAGRAGRYRRYDWDAGRYAEEVAVAPAPLVVVEGVGSGSLPTARLADLLVWVEAPVELRMRRGLERDGDAFAPYWVAWAAAEERLFAEQRTRERADLVVDGTGEPPQAVRR